MFKVFEMTDIIIIIIVVIVITNNNLTLNTKKTEAMIVAKKAPLSSADTLLNNNKFNVVETFKQEPHISQLIERVSPKILLLNRLAGFLGTKILLRICKQTILPVIDYGFIVWHECKKSLSDEFERLQNQAILRVILRANKTTCTHCKQTFQLQLSQTRETLCTSQSQDVSQVLSELTRPQVDHQSRHRPIFKLKKIKNNDLEVAHPLRLVVLCLPDSWLNWNLEMLFFEERGKPGYPEGNLSEQGENQEETQHPHILAPQVCG